MVKTTTLTDNFTVKQFHAEHGEDAIILFAMDADKKLKVRVASGNFEATKGDRIVAIVLPPPADEITHAQENSTEGLT